MSACSVTLPFLLRHSISAAKAVFADGMIQRATVPGKWLCHNPVRFNPKPTGSVLSTQEILDPSVHYPVVNHHLESSPYPKAGLICHEWFKERLCQENGCVPITYGTFHCLTSCSGSYPSVVYAPCYIVVKAPNTNANFPFAFGEIHVWYSVASVVKCANLGRSEGLVVQISDRLAINVPRKCMVFCHLITIKYQLYKSLQTNRITVPSRLMLPFVKYL